MSYTRAAATEYLATEFAALWAAAGQRPDRVLLDSAWRALGVAESDLLTASAPDTDAAQVEATLDYYGLRRLARALAPAVSLSRPTLGSENRSDLYTHVMGLLAQAEARLKSYGLLPGAASAAMFRLNLDLLEPATDEG